MPSIVLLGDTTGTVELTGPPVRVDSLFSPTRSIYTVACYVKNFTGQLKIQGTLVSKPEHDDWFDIYLDGFPELTFPQNPNHPTGFPDHSDVGSFQTINMMIPLGDTGIVTYSFQGNFTFLRARVQRSYLQRTLTPETFLNLEYLGSVQQILLGF